MTTSDSGSSPSLRNRSPLKRLPRDPSVEHLRKQAKTLHRAYQGGLAAAQSRVASVFQGKSITLADAQHVIATEYGFASWPKMAAFIETTASESTSWNRSERDNLPKAANDADLARLTALLGAAEFTQADLDIALGRACCNMRGRHEADYRACAEALCDAGANPDGHFGEPDDVILKASCEFRNPIGMRFLLERGADARGTTEPPRPDRLHNSPMRLLLATYGRGDVHLKHEGIALLEQYGAGRPAEVDELAYAIFRDDVDDVNRLLDVEPARIAEPLDGFMYGNILLNGATYLHQAVEFEAIKCVDVICQRGYAHGIHINTRAKVVDGLGGQTPIFHCTASLGGGNVPMFRHLIERYGQWIDFSVRATMRMYVGRANGEQTLRNVTPLEMLEAHASPSGAAPLWPSQEEERAELRRRDARSTLQNAIAAGEIAEATRLMDTHPDEVGPHLWPAAVHQAGSFELTRELLDRGVDPNQCSAPRKPLHLAASKGHVDIVRLLLEHGADSDVVDGEHVTPIELATGAISGERSPNEQAIVSLLRDAGATVTPFTAMLLKDDDATIEAFEADPVLLHATGWQHFPALICAARAARPRVVDYLLNQGIAPDAQLDNGDTPLWFVCQSMADADNRLAVATLLLDAGADPNRRCEDGTTPLHFAAWRGPVAMVDLLLARGADARLRDDAGKTPADVAGQGSTDTQRQLIAARLTEATS